MTDLEHLASYLINCGSSPFLEWLTWFIKKSKQFNDSDITNDIAALMLTFSVNGPLTLVRGRKGACVAGGGGVRGRRDGHCSGRYASYWNAFLFPLDTPQLWN